MSNMVSCVEAGFTGGLTAFPYLHTLFSRSSIDTIANLGNYQYTNHNMTYVNRSGEKDFDDGAAPSGQEAYNKVWEQPRKAGLTHRL